MIGDQIPDQDHVLRYVKPSLLVGTHVNGGAFALRKNETRLSVNWLEILQSAGFEDPINEIRRLSRIKFASTGKFVKLNIGQTKQHVSTAANEAGISLDLSVLAAPLPGEPGIEPDPSHAEIHGLPDYANDAAMVVGDLLAECILLPLIPAKVT